MVMELTVVDMIREQRTMLQAMARNGVGTSWYRYLELYDDYTRLCREGHKQMYVMGYLSDVYGITQTQIYRILGKLLDKWKE